MEVETIPTLDAARRRRERETDGLSVVHADLDGMHAQLEMFRDGLWRQLDTVDKINAKVAALETKVAVIDTKLDALALNVADVKKALKPDPTMRAAVGVLVFCVLLITLKQVGVL